MFLRRKHILRELSARSLYIIVNLEFYAFLEFSVLREWTGKWVPGHIWPRAFLEAFLGRVFRAPLYVITKQTSTKLKLVDVRFSMINEDARKIRPIKALGRAFDQKFPGTHWPAHSWSTGHLKKSIHSRVVLWRELLVVSYQTSIRGMKTRIWTQY